MAKHVRMHWLQPGTSGRLGEEIVHCLTRERLLTFGDKQPGERVSAASQISLDRAEFIASDGMLHIQAALQTPDPQMRRGRDQLHRGVSRLLR